MKAMEMKGSLEAAQAIASSIKTLLGPSQSTKCCVNSDDDRDAIICSNAAKILQYLEVENPNTRSFKRYYILIKNHCWVESSKLRPKGILGYVINDACQAMHKTYGCGCTTLVCMIGFWSRSALMLQHEGVPVPVIGKLFEEALHSCFQVLEEIAHPIQETLHDDLQNKPQKDSSSNAARLSRTITTEELWATAEDDVSEVDIAQRSDNGLLAINKPLGYSLACLDGDEDKRETPHLIVPKLPNQAQNEPISMADSRGSSAFDVTVEDEFDSCFDDLTINIGKFPKNVINIESEGVCRSVSSSEGISCRNNARHVLNIPSNKSELKRLDQMLKDLSFPGQKLMSPKVSTGKYVTEILKSCHNLSINSPKTQREESYEPHNSFCQRSSDLGFIGKEDIGRLGKMLAHGKDKVMALAVEVIFHQMPPTRKKKHFNRFDVDENALNIERIVGPTSEHSQVINGILLRQEAQLVDYPMVALRVVLVNGDITEDYRHTGFKDSFHTKTIFNEASYKNLSINTISWCQRILSVFQTLNIGVVVARGSIDKGLEECCQALKIQTLSGISSKTLQLLSHSLGSTAVVYLTDLKECHIGKPVFLHHWSGPQPGMTNDKGSFVILQLAENQKAEAALPQSGRDSTKQKENMKESTEEKELLQTVLLCGPTEQLAVDLELSFWTCVFHLRNTINCGCVLPGAGKTEMSCINNLRQISENPDIKDRPSKSSSWLQASLSSYRPAVYTAFADGLVEFLVNLVSNSGYMVNYGQALTAVQKALDDHEQSRLQYPLIADDFVAKKNAWSKAIGVVQVMLQSDMAIVTGSQTSTDSVQG